MTRKYEFVAIFQPTEEGVTNGKDAIASQFGDSQITITEEQDMGEKVLAYEIADQDRGHYYLYEIEADPNAITPISQSLKLKSEVLKFLFVKK